MLAMGTCCYRCVMRHVIYIIPVTTNCSQSTNDVVDLRLCLSLKISLTASNEPSHQRTPKGEIIISLPHACHTTLPCERSCRSTTKLIYLSIHIHNRHNDKKGIASMCHEDQSTVGRNTPGRSLVSSATAEGAD